MTTFADDQTNAPVDVNDDDDDDGGRMLMRLLWFLLALATNRMFACMHCTVKSGGKGSKRLPLVLLAGEWNFSLNEREKNICYKIFPHHKHEHYFAGVKRGGCNLSDSCFLVIPKKNYHRPVICGCWGEK